MWDHLRKVTAERDVAVAALANAKKESAMSDADRAAYAAQRAQDAVDDAREDMRHIRADRLRLLAFTPVAGAVGGYGVLLPSWWALAWAIPVLLLCLGSVAFLLCTLDDPVNARKTLRNAERHQRNLVMGWKEP